MVTIPESQGKLRIKEIHTYKVVLGQQVQVTWQKGEGIVSLFPPYQEYDRPSPTNTARLLLGELQLTAADGSLLIRSDIHIPATALSDSPLRTGRRVVWEQDYFLTEPGETPFDIRAEVVDELAKYPHRSDDTAFRLFTQSGGTPHALDLDLHIWVSDLYRARLERSPTYKLNEMLREREHRNQVLIPSLNDKDRIAQSLVALANNADGGRLLLGVEPNGDIKGIVPNGSEAECRHAVTEVLLNAALRTTPSIPFAMPDYILAQNGQWVARVEVPGGATKSYRIADTVYRRTESRTITSKAIDSIPPDMPPSGPVPNVDSLYKEKNTKNSIVVDAYESLEKIHLGEYISGLINVGQKKGTILIYNLDHKPQWFGASLEQRVELWIQSHLSRMTPPITTQQIRYTFPTLKRDDKPEKVVLIEISNSTVPLAYFDDIAYEWDPPTAIPLTSEAQLDCYMANTKVGGMEQAEGEIEFVHGEIPWPVRPLEGVAREKAPDGILLATYDSQRRAMLWTSSRLPLPRTQHAQVHGGYKVILRTPLRQALTHLEPDGRVSKGEPVLQGTLHFRHKGLLLSGAQIALTRSSQTMPLETLPLFRETEIRIELEINANQLFQQREHVALMHFRLPDIVTDTALLINLRRACNDLGFQLDAEEPRADDFKILRGYRTDQFCDLDLHITLMQEKTEVEREIRYMSRKDRRQTASVSAVGWIRLSGKGIKAKAELGKLQLALYTLMAERLPYLQNN